MQILFLSICWVFLVVVAPSSSSSSFSFIGSFGVRNVMPFNTERRNTDSLLILLKCFLSEIFSFLFHLRYGCVSVCVHALTLIDYNQFYINLNEHDQSAKHAIQCFQIYFACFNFNESIEKNWRKKKAKIWIEWEVKRRKIRGKWWSFWRFISIHFIILRNNLRKSSIWWMTLSSKDIWTETPTRASDDWLERKRQNEIHNHP